MIVEGTLHVPDGHSPSQPNRFRPGTLLNLPAGVNPVIELFVHRIDCRVEARVSAERRVISAERRVISARAAVSSTARWLLISMSVSVGCQSGRSSWYAWAHSPPNSSTAASTPAAASDLAAARSASVASGGSCGSARRWRKRASSDRLRGLRLRSMACEGCWLAASA